MLNLNDPVRYSAEEQSFIDDHLKPQGKEGWNDSRNETKSIKNRISNHTIIAQGGRCAYCEKILAKGEVEIDHIANKGLYGEFTYEPYNLVSSCTCCNSPCNKGQKDCVVAPVDRLVYVNNEFTIVHPYFDNPDDHLKYMDDEHIYFDINNCSQKGKATIDMFNWNDTWAIYKRITIAHMKHYPVDVLQLAVEISTYK